MAGLCLAAYLGAAWITADVSPLRPDTPSYLYFDPSRSIGYPSFLWISRQLGGAVLAVPLQMLVLTISLFFLGLAFFKYTGRPVLSVLFQLALVLSPEMWKFAAMLLTEATATAAVALWCAQLLRTVRAPDSALDRVPYRHFWRGNVGEAVAGASFHRRDNPGSGTPKLEAAWLGSGADRSRADDHSRRDPRSQSSSAWVCRQRKPRGTGRAAAYPLLLRF